MLLFLSNYIKIFTHNSQNLEECKYMYSYILDTHKTQIFFPVSNINTVHWTLTLGPQI
jgi:hypothetical protein